MEVEIRGHHGIPASSVISIRAGRTRRQAHISQLDRSFKFPLKVEECSSVKVDILDLAGTARIACKPGVNEYAIPLETPIAGDEYTGMEVDLRLSPLGDSGGGTNGGKREEAECQTRDKKQTDAKAYLEKHGVTGFMQFVMQSLMKDKPDDPYAFLQRQITKRMMDIDANHSTSSEKSQLEDLLAQLSQPTSDWVTEEQLQDLEKKAELAAEQLRNDNEELASTSAKMKGRYKALVMTGDPAGRCLAGDAQLDATFGSLSAMQRDVTDLTQENAALVTELVRIQEAVQSMQDEIDSCKG
eukprot:TRINITY_DN111375_c0_g1_i1.p1 TRINITY_DN111375_c0_g1~~TRINITY_DN111375_c0_g1_i1.p1  ORF type:complete len:299 (-),score=69.99 TRINITY_DN111375_c0_g1_i1:88-984(-)